MTSTALPCPTCGATQAAGALECRRCKSDLSLMAAMNQLEAELRRQALEALADGDLQRMLHSARRRFELSPDEEAGRLLAVAHLARGEFARAVAVFDKLREKSGAGL